MYDDHAKNYQSSLLADGSIDWLNEVLRWTKKRG